MVEWVGGGGIFVKYHTMRRWEVILDAFFFFACGLQMHQKDMGIHVYWI